MSETQTFVTSKASQLVGRQEEVQVALHGLNDKQCLFIHGNPGLGKAALAHEAIQQLSEGGAVKRRPYTVDLTDINTDLHNLHPFSALPTNGCQYIDACLKKA